MDKQVKNLDTSANNRSYVQYSGNVFAARQNGALVNNGSVLITDAALYKEYFYDPVKTSYAKLTNESGAATNSSKTGYKTEPYFTQDEINKFVPLLNKLKKSPFAGRMFVLEKILTDPVGSQKLFNAMLLGYIGPDFKAAQKLADKYDFNTRLKNLDATYAYTDSLYAALLQARENENCLDALSQVKPAILKVQGYRTDIAQNTSWIKTNYADITNYITKNSDEALWVTGNTNSPDLQTFGTRRFTISAGLTQMFAYNNNNQFNPLFKFTVSADFYFTSIDKNVNFKYVARPPTPTDTSSHYLESRLSFWERFSMSFGITYGAMSNKSFDNVYNNFSFTLGPSYVITHGLKVGTGVAWLKRYDINPLTTLQEKTISLPMSLLVLTMT